jgi:hypothetical protein
MVLSDLSHLGVLAQLGERIAGSDEVRGSIPLNSIQRKVGPSGSTFFFVWSHVGGEPRGSVPRGRNGRSGFEEELQI